MRTFFIVACILVAIPLSSTGQTPDATIRMKNFTRVWGFLKYHHPGVAKGNLDWDSVFVNNVKRINKTTSNKDFNSLLLSIIDKAGKVEKAVSQKHSDSLFTLNNKDSIAWMDTSTVFNKEVKSRLRMIYQNKNGGPNKYISIRNNTADYSGENKYEDIGFPNESYRLLFLARFWNIINYYAPYKYLVDKSWDNVLNMFIPKFVAAKDSVAYYKVLLELSKALQDGHCGLSKDHQVAEVNNLVFGKYTVPFYTSIINDTVMVRALSNDSPGKTADIKKGDVLLKVDNIPVERLMEERRKYISASNDLSEAHHLSWFLLDGQAPKVSVTVKRGSKIFTTTVHRTASTDRKWGELVNYTANDKGYKKLDDSTLLIYAMQIWNGNLDTLKSMIREAKAVIFDVRNYPQNDAFYYIVDPFLLEPKVINYITEPIANMPGLFKWIQSPKIGQVNKDVFKGKVIILADERTQSQGEYSCMVLQTIPGAITIGRQTAGADGLVTYIPMGGHLSLSYSGYGVYYPDKGQTQRTGIKIDITVPKTVAEIIKDKDPTLERALIYLKEGR